ncbi:hypothetical protein M3P05_15395 [Sansalvadorimonas sp. 2012CJ34-2]|uniref:NAD/FAD-utilizing enzyme apparently involved in cell division n=1 Tax=Parendozoicomonas callyspongiae TaxID=2942213 RepID=A0ABT0PIX2_9GAMM|nr:hypothetical protein [Sansalvadorimonas sp. 2012CJ34-2]MCL6271308.1 hypothetical protein [Sansalvadorimonas sp. 2012CJ34-2]
MKQHHYMFDYLDDLQHACADLEEMGIEHRNLHVAHNSQLSLDKRHLNGMGYFHDNDMVHSALRGFLFGILVAACTAFLLSTWLGHLEVGFIVTGFVTLIMLGFSTWVGGLIGASHDNWRLAPYHDQLSAGKSVLIVDVDSEQEQMVTRMMSAMHREASHTGESPTGESPFEGGWHLREKEIKQVA